MDKMSLLVQVRQWIGSFGFRLFLWAYEMTQEEYFQTIEKDIKANALAWALDIVRNASASKGEWEYRK